MPKKILLTLFLLVFFSFVMLIKSAPISASCTPATSGRFGPACLTGTACTIGGQAQCCTDPAVDCAGGSAGFIPSSTQASTWYDQTPAEFQKKVFGGDPNEIFGERYTYAQVNWIFNSLISMFTPRITSLGELKGFLDILIVNNGSPTFAEYAKLGIPGILMGGITEAVQPPASGVQYLASLGQNMQIIPSAYAQSNSGYGFDALGVVRKLWSATRNMAYLLTVVILVAAGFAIMFRVKINPQTVVSLQTLIPKLVISLILITFSYAIAGLILDLIFVVIAAFLGLLSSFGVIQASLPRAIEFFTSSSYSGIISYFIWPWLLIFTLGLIPLPGPFEIIPAALLLIGLIGIIFLSWTLFKIWWMLVKTQITLIFLIIFGPFQIMLDLIPGQSGFTSWLRNIFANASVFAVVPIMFIMNMLFWRPLAGALNFQLPDWLSSFNPLGSVTVGVGGSTWLPNLPFVNGTGFIFNLVAGYAILALTPKVADMIRDALKVPAFKYGTAFGFRENVVQPFENMVRLTVAGRRLFTKAGPKLSHGEVTEPEPTFIQEGQ